MNPELMYRQEEDDGPCLLCMRQTDWLLRLRGANGLRGDWRLCSLCGNRVRLALWAGALVNRRR